MKKKILPAIIVIAVAAVTNFATQRIINIFNPDIYTSVSYKHIVICSILPLFLLMFNLNIKPKTLVFTTFFYSIIYTIVSIYL